MFALAYASYSTVDSSELDLEGLARHAASKNATLGITGYLCYDHGVPGLQKRLTDIQYDHLDEVISSLHEKAPWVL